MQLRDLSGKHIHCMLAIQGNGEDSWGWELKALLCDVRHFVGTDRKGDLCQKTRVSVLIKPQYDDNQVVTFELSSDYEIDEPIRAQS